MRRSAIIITLTLLPLLALAAQPETIEQRVVVIFGNTDVGVWEQQYSHSLHQGLNLDARVKVSLEFIGLNFAQESEMPLLAESIRMRHNSLPADLVMAVQPSANSFLDDWGHLFAGDLPRLYVLPGQSTHAKITASDGGSMLMSGWSTAVEGTYRLISRLLPGTGTVFVISGDGVSDLSYLARARRVLDSQRDNIERQYLVGRSPEELQRLLQSAPEGSAILMLSYVHSESGANYRTADIVRVLDANVNLPIFAPFDSLMGFGIVGGNMTSADLYGRESARIALEILKNPGATISASLPTRTIFDATKLAHWRIDMDRLPTDSELINKPQSVWDEYAAQLVTIILVIAFQLVIIVALVNALRRKRIAEQERESQTRLFEAVINGIHDAIFITDLNHTITVTNTNGLESTFGYSAEGVSGKKLDELIASKNVLENTHVDPIRAEFIDAQGGQFPGELVNAPIIDADGKHRGYFAIVRDVSDRLKKEEQLLHVHKMEALGNLAGGIAHDFNNLLAAILGNTEIAQMRARGLEPILQSLDKVMSAGERARDLVRQILTFSRRAEVQSLAQTNLAEVLTQSTGFLKASIPSRIEVNVDIADDLWDISGNETEIHQIILNLANNAVHAMGTKGELTLSLKNTTTDSETQLYRGVLPAGSYVLLSVTDTGGGIPPDILDRITEPFFTTKAPGEGTGMGLALVFGILEHHGGMLDVRSVMERGTTFDLYFPAVTDRAPLTSPPGEQPLQHGDGQHIMLVDDEPIVLETCERELSMLGYTAECFTNPEDALACFRQRPADFDLVMSDLTMPGMDGLTLLASIKRLREDIPVVLCTGYSDVRSDGNGNLIDIAAELSKPFRISEMARALSAALT